MSLIFVCREIYVRASIHIITSLKLLGTLISVFEQKKANEGISSPFMLKNFFLSERRLVKAIVRVMLEYMKDVYFS